MAGYAFVLLTPDDVGGRDRVCCVYKTGVEIPSDILGVIYVEYLHDIKERFTEIIRELQSAGYRLGPSY
jgi:predicted nucleotide-binding protein